MLTSPSCISAALRSSDLGEATADYATQRDLLVSDWALNVRQERTSGLELARYLSRLRVALADCKCSSEWFAEYAALAVCTVGSDAERTQFTQRLPTGAEHTLDPDSAANP
jgi:hypothetical protein